MNYRLLSGNVLKIIAAVCMMIDHIGYILFPDVLVFRIIGRIAFPIFAFMIAEGCRYTKNKLRYFSVITLCGIVFQLFLCIFLNHLHMNIFITFSLSILMIYSLNQRGKEQRNTKLFLITVIIVYILNLYFSIDYGFFGCLLPVIAYLVPESASNETRIYYFTAGLVILSMAHGWIQLFSLLSAPLLLFYSGQRGKLNMKYFFYIFYPAHLIILYGINLLIKTAKM